MTDDIFRGLGIEVELEGEDAFLLVKETLTRIGVASRTQNVLWPSCNILHKRGRYAIMMFKELFILDGKETNITENDLQRRNTIAKLLEDWGLVKILREPFKPEELAPLYQIKILSYKEKQEYTIIPKYNVGKRG